jgi:hypothetical protein
LPKAKNNKGILLYPPAPLEKNNLVFEQPLFAGHFPGICVIGPHVLDLGKVPDELLLLFCREMFVREPFHELGFAVERASRWGNETWYFVQQYRQ